MREEIFKKLQLVLFAELWKLLWSAPFFFLHPTANRRTTKNLFYLDFYNDFLRLHVKDDQTTELADNRPPTYKEMEWKLVIERFFYIF